MINTADVKPGTSLPDLSLPNEEDMLKAISEAKEATTQRIVCFLFAAPGTKISKDEISPILDYLHHRSSKYFDIYCAGYTTHSPKDSDRKEPVKSLFSIAEVNWYFSNADFNEARIRLESVSKWKFSGETDLVIAEEFLLPSDQFSCNFKKAICCNLEQMQKDDAFSSVRAFLEQLSRLAEERSKNPSRDSSGDYLSNSLGLKSASSACFDLVLSILPEKLRSFYNSTKHYAVKDLSK